MSTTQHLAYHDPIASRRKFLARVAGTSFAAAGLSLWPGAKKLFAVGSDEDISVTPATQKAIDRGLGYLAREQKTAGRLSGTFGTAGFSSGVAVTALAGLAFMCSGDPPGEGIYGKHIDRAIDYLLRNTQDTGFISVANGMDQMYGHGFATLFLTQAYGMAYRRDDLRGKLSKSVELIVSTQNDEGGWRYRPQKADADLSITICQIMALRGASDCGLSVPRETRERAINYVKRSQRSDGSFMYTLPQGQATFPLTAAGVVSLYSAGIYEGREVENGLRWLQQSPPGRGASVGGGYYFYGHYYAAQAMWHAGGDYWRRWYSAIRQELLRAQLADGSWQDPSVCNQFGAAVACIILQLPNNYVPIFAQ